MNLPRVFIELEKIFSNHNYKLYMIGGTSRDFLLGKEISDYDLVTDATPEQMKKFLDFDDSFVKMGSVHISFLGARVDITTLREEQDYVDYRHPSKIKFIKDIKKDSYRRDFTINALYIDREGNIFDFHGGLDDLHNHLIAMIGEPDKRFNEDPLRILRALRFSLSNDFSLTPSLRESLVDNVHLLKKISYVRSLNEINKMKEISLEKANWILKIHHVDDYIPIDYKIKDRLNVIDMHCDTLTKSSLKEQGLYNLNGHLNIKKMYQGEYMMQCFAIFLPITYFSHPFEEFKSYVSLFKEQMEENSTLISQVYNYQDILNNKGNFKMSALLTIEDAGMLENKMENVVWAYEQGVRMMTLTWNYPNGIGYPNFVNNDTIHPNTTNGLTPYGIELVHKMNELGMIIDVSHLSDAGFFDVIKYSTQPIVASHSNSRSVHNHVRNLSDEMILALKKNGGVMGINYCGDFVSSSKTNQIPDIIKHVNHIKEVGGIDMIALGSDFDGIPTPLGMSDATMTHALKDALVKEGYTKNEIDKIFYKNFLRVFKKVCG